MLGAVNNNTSHTNPHIDKAEIGQNQPVTANSKSGDISKAEQSKPLAIERDEYIHRDSASEKFPGIYRLEKDKDGNRKIVFDRPDPAGKNKSAEPVPEIEQAGKSPESASNPDKDDIPPKDPEKENGPEKPDGKKGGLWGAVNTDRVDREIKQLKEKRQQLAQQMNQVRDDEEKRKNLEQQLAQVESELRPKDTDVYRRANATFTFGASNEDQS